MKRIIALFLCLLSYSAFALTTPNSFISPQTPTRGIVRFAQGVDTAGTYKTIYTAGANGSRCYAIWGSNNDGSTTHDITIGLFNGGVEYATSLTTTVKSAGTSTGVPNQSFLAGFVGLPVDQYGNNYIQMIYGDTLQVTFATTIGGGSSTYISLIASCSDF